MTSIIAEFLISLLINPLYSGIGWLLLLLRFPDKEKRMIRKKLHYEDSYSVAAGRILGRYAIACIILLWLITMGLIAYTCFRHGIV